MQMDDLTMMLVKIAVAVCAALITAYVLPYLKALKEDAKWGTVIDMIEIAVRAAEQIIKGSGQGPAKKAEVVKFVSEWLERNGIGMMEDELDQLIEAAVYQMKQEG